MMKLHGPGKYDPEAQLVHGLTGGGVMLIVIDGHLAHGCAVKMTKEQMVILPALLRQIADGMDRDLAAEAP